MSNAPHLIITWVSLSSHNREEAHASDFVISNLMEARHMTTNERGGLGGTHGYESSHSMERGQPLLSAAFGCHEGPLLPTLPTVKREIGNNDFYVKSPNC